MDVDFDELEAELDQAQRVAKRKRERHAITGKVKLKPGEKRAASGVTPLVARPRGNPRATPSKSKKRDVGATAMRLRCRSAQLSLQGAPAEQIGNILYPVARQSAPSSRRIRVGTDFAGINTPAAAMELLGLNVQHVFMSETSPSCKRLLKHQWPSCEHWYDDAQARGMHDVDVYVTTPPCQCYSLVGTRGGSSDSRGRFSTFV